MNADPHLSHPELPVSHEGWRQSMDVEQHFSTWRAFRALFTITGAAVSLLLALLALFLV